MRETPLIVQVREVLSAEEFVRLVERFGGQRIYVPRRLPDGHMLADALGQSIAVRLSEVVAGHWLVVPLAHLERALHYEALGLKDHEIAQRLGMTRGGVQRLLDRARLVPEPPRKREPRENPDQLTLF